jgi:hypothetical protein
VLCEAKEAAADVAAVGEEEAGGEERGFASSAGEMRGAGADASV